MEFSLIESIGYAASLFVAISFLVKDIVTIRLINIVGCALFVIYGFSIQAYPVAVMNTMIIVIHLYHLSKLLREKKSVSEEQLQNA